MKFDAFRVTAWSLVAGLALMYLATRPADKKETHVARAAAQAPERPKVDLTKAAQTVSHAIVCPRDLPFSRRADVLDKVYDAFTSVWGRSEKVRSAGCEEWQEGIRVYQTERASAGANFVGFSTSPDGIQEYFTMSSNLENVPEKTVAQQAKKSSGEVQAAAPDTERAEFLKWFKQTSVCMRRAADLKIRLFTLEKKDLADEANILEITDYTRTMCGGGLRTFLTGQGGYSVPDADAMLDDLAERMVKARLGTGREDEDATSSR